MKKAVMYGAGNIGRGFIGQLFSQSDYEVYFIDINSVIIDRLNEDHCYPIKIVTDEGYDEIVVKNVHGINAINTGQVADAIASADIMATAVGVNVLPRIVRPVVEGLRKRWSSGNFTPLNVIICENMLDANHYMERLIKQELSDGERSIFDRTIGLVEASIGRMVPVMTMDMQEGNPLRVYVEEYCKLPVDKDAFKGEIPSIVNMMPVSPFSFYIHRKLFMHNMGHAIAAYLGFLNGFTYIWEACRNSTIKIITLRALQESVIALSKEHGVPVQVLLEHADNLIYRFGNRLLGDTIERVGKDPIRKLSENDRLIGAAKLCLMHGVTPVYIAVGIAAGFMFKPKRDESAAKIQEFTESEGIESALRKFCGISGSNSVSMLVIEFYNMLRQGENLERILERAEKLKNDMYVNMQEAI